jgi:gamma-glutamyltranspeptidase/glutathione hydrolase/leukotriene-C4 hydrolase
MRAHAFGVELIFPPPPSSAAVIVAALHILSGFPLRLTAAGTLGTHRFIEAMKHAFALRMNLGDPGPDPSNPFVNITKQDALLEDILSRKYADGLRSDILDNTTQPPENYGGQWNVLRAPPEDHGTCHFSVVGGDGMAVAMTTTINTPYGSNVMSPSTGILLNNEMADFSTPGQHDVFNLPPAEANFIRPGKKPLSSMSPTIVLQRKLRAVVGGSGGPLIVSAVLQTLVRLLAECDKGIELISKPRFHHQLLPDNLFVEDWTASGTALRFPERELQLLEQRGHNITKFPWGACVSAIIADPDDSSLLTGLGDPRKDGAPAVY